MNLSIVMPCYNGEDYIEQSLNTLTGYLRDKKQIFGDFEIIVVDDGSKDNTKNLICSKFPEIIFLHNTHNEGKGAAVRKGMLSATGAYSIFIDADMPFELESLDMLFHYLDFKEYDVCIGTRNIANAQYFAPRSRARRLASWLFTLIVSRLVVTGVRDTQCGLKGFRQDVAHYLFTESRIKGFAFDVEVLYLAYKNDFDIKRIPVFLVAEGHSTVSLLKHGPRMVVDILAIPLRWYTNKYVLYSHSPESE
ncbi:MAG: glycosyltransferase [Candidatus Hydrogenedentes bacterium]|nr:glycosyltransferase [Candidatus Hydrogenedentota bacterium]